MPKTNRGKPEKNSNITDNPESITGTVENSNINILNNIGNYLQYIRDNINRIILQDGLKYSEPMDKKKEYPAFTYTQFQYLLGRVYDEVFSVNLELLCKPQIYNNYNKPFYDTEKVKLCYEVYCKLCQFYGFVCSVEGFYIFSGISENTLKEWLSSGYCDVYKIAVEKGKNSVVSRFENSSVPILNLAAGNYKYKLQTPLEEREQAAAVEVLPDLSSLMDRKKGLLKAPE